MTTVLRMERATRRLQRTWTAASVALIALAAAFAIVAGGESTWLRIALGAVAAQRCWAACMHRASLVQAVVAATAAVVLVPIDARLDRTAVAVVGSVAIVAAAECAHVARRLVTVAPVTQTHRDLTCVARTATLGALAAAVTVAVGSTGSWATRAVIAGLAISAGAFTWLVRERRQVA